MFTLNEMCKTLDISNDGYEELKSIVQETVDLFDGKLNVEETDLSELFKYIPLNEIITRLPMSKFSNKVTSFSIWQLKQILYIYENAYPQNKEVRKSLDELEKYIEGKTTVETLYARASRVLPLVEQAKFEVEYIYDSKGLTNLNSLCSIAKIVECVLNLSLTSGVGNSNIEVMKCFGWVGRYAYNCGKSTDDVAGFPATNTDPTLFKARPEKFKEIFLNNNN